MLLLSLLLISSSLVYPKEKKLKINGVVYVLDLNTGLASVGENFKKNHKGTLEGDVALLSYINYKKKTFTVTTVGIGAFLFCKKLNSIRLSNTINELRHYALWGMDNLKLFSVDPNNQYYQSSDGVLFSKDMKSIVRFPPGRLDKSYTIPSSVDTIGELAFYGCHNLKNIVIPNSVKYIKYQAFYDCDFRTITLPNGLTNIEEEAFSFNSSLESIKLPPSVCKIEEMAFFACVNLTSVTYQNKNLIFTGVFKGCDKLTSNNLIYEVPTNSYIELAKEGKTEFQYKLAMCYKDGEGYSRNVKSAIEWFSKAAEKGHTLSQSALGNIYLNGLGIDINYQEAVKWYSLAAKGGDASAQYNLGNCYFNGLGVKQNYQSAFSYYNSAAIQGYDKAEEVMGSCYYFGTGVDKNYSEAVKWYRISANKGNAVAAYYLGLCYNEGNGITKNSSEALKWIEKAVNGGVEKANGLYCVLLYDVAVNNMNSGYYSSAISEFTSLIKYDKDNVDAYINRGYCYLNQQVKDYSSAESDFLKALELDKNNEVAKNNMRFVATYKKRIYDAVESSKIADQYYNNRDYVNAVSYYAKSISLDNSKPYPYYSIGYCYYSCELYNDAINYFNQALSIDPNYTDARKAVKSAKTMRILTALSQALNAVSNSLNSAYGNSINYGSSSNYASSTHYSSNTTPSSYTKQRTVCSYCHGTGHVSSTVATYGQTGEKWCDYCKEYVPLSHCCQCKTCPSCLGKGYR